MLSQQAYLLLYARTQLKPLAPPPPPATPAAAAAASNGAPSGGLARRASGALPPAPEPHAAAAASPQMPRQASLKSNGSNGWHEVPHPAAAAGASPPAAPLARGFSILGKRASSGDGGAAPAQAPHSSVTTLPRASSFKLGGVGGGGHVPHIVLKPKGATAATHANGNGSSNGHGHGGAAAHALQPPPAGEGAGAAAGGAAAPLPAQHARALLSRNGAAEEADEGSAAAAADAPGGGAAVFRSRRRRLGEPGDDAPPPPHPPPQHGAQQAEGGPRTGAAGGGPALQGEVVEGFVPEPPAFKYARRHEDPLLRRALEEVHVRLWRAFRCAPPSSAQLCFFLLGGAAGCAHGSLGSACAVVCCVGVAGSERGGRRIASRACGRRSNRQLLAGFVDVAAAEVRRLCGVDGGAPAPHSNGGQGGGDASSAEALVERLAAEEHAPWRRQLQQLIGQAVNEPHARLPPLSCLRGAGLAPPEGEGEGSHGEGFDVGGEALSMQVIRQLTAAVRAAARAGKRPAAEREGGGEKRPAKRAQLL